MKLIGAVLLALHGVAHLVGFRAAFWPRAGERGTHFLGSELSGSLWLLLALAFVGCAALALAKHDTWNVTVLWASSVSLFMCALTWPDAKIGAVIDVALIAVALLGARSGGPYVEARFGCELRAASLARAPGVAEIIDERAVRALPPSVRRYLTFMGVMGRPRDWSLRARFDARFRRLYGQWQECEALQYDTRLSISRRFYMQLSLRGFLPVTVRDTYSHGRGRMSAKAFDLFDVAEGTGHELDEGELVTYLNDAILMAPSLLLGPEVTWTELDARTFDVSLNDSELTVTARVWLNEQGAPVDFSTTDRFLDMPDGKRVRTEWRTPVRGWQQVNGRQLPIRAQAVWQLPGGPFAYADFTIDPTKIDFNVPPE